MNIQIPFYTALKKYGFLVSLTILTACAGTPANGPVPDGYYRVQRGDNLYRIGLRFGQSTKTLAAWNNLRDPSKIEVGQVLRVRSGSSSSTSSTSRTRSARTVAPTNRLHMQWPIDNGKANIIKTYNGTSNKGIDIGGVRGTPVRAAADGKVLYAAEGLRGYGKLILISHNSSTLTAYAHNDTFLVKKGQTVKAGQTIATMGSSDTDRVKLHFEVRINGKAVNPTPYLN
ncbi:peptidoglycan DD-metalloendopeptidase family protein [Neisseria montereyensis]|uniref:Peptidoglycan DD-metalloendopeptidase family protein n=1 Tax=Neisseria montereyensis TaxID=2973938 RepID=A0ABT2FBK7_9NEIS|nr:peptidoglycan DD-metalloendopeptidase family protein [Neisseria montereyensis]MCS4533593.1 peptidoglycan DD-metalloendopeptidase family protein [Neisseria montereyensis]